MIRRFSNSPAVWAFASTFYRDSVLNLLITPLQAKGYHIIRYNSRGVGGSSGWPSFTGFTEGEDLKAVVEWSLSYVQSLPGGSQINAVTIIVCNSIFVSKETCSCLRAGLFSWVSHRNPLPCTPRSPNKDILHPDILPIRSPQFPHPISIFNIHQKAPGSHTQPDLSLSNPHSLRRPGRIHK